MNERYEKMGQREELRARRKIVAAEIASHRDSLRAALPLEAEAAELDGPHIATLGFAMNKRLEELAEIDRRLGVLTGQLGG